MLQPSSLTETPREAIATPKPAFLTDDSVAALRFAADALSAGMATALVTLVEIRGGAARSPGAQMVVREDGVYCGFVSGGCVEAAAACEALDAIRTGADRTVIYGKGSPWFDIVLPCGGGITLCIHLLRSAAPLLTVLGALERRDPMGLRYNPHDQTLLPVSDINKTGWHNGMFDVSYRPCVRALIYGRSVESEATVKLAQAAGYDVQIGDTPARTTLIDADTAVVLLYHDLHRELPALEAALNAAPFYIGALGSQRTHQQRVLTLRERGFAATDIARIKAPIGLFPKARDARSLALSVLADVAAARLQSQT